MLSEVRRMNVDHGQLNAARERESSWLHCYWMIPESVDVPRSMEMICWIRTLTKSRMES